MSGAAGALAGEEGPPGCGSPSWAPGAALAGGWVLRRLAGAGATAEVWEAERDGHAVALKALRPHLAARPELVEALRREGRKGRQFRHPALVGVLGEGVAGGRPFLVMELLRGATLRDAWPAPLGRREVARLLAGPAAALARLHEAGAVHGDVTPANLFRVSAEEVRLLDLGALRMAGRSALDETLWAPPRGMPLATRAWAAPERLRGEPPDPRDDVHALARVAVALLRGPPPRALRAALGPRAARPGTAGALIRALRGPGWFLHG